MDDYHVDLYNDKKTNVLYTEADGINIDYEYNIDSTFL